MSLKTILISLIVAGVLAGLVLLSTLGSGSARGDDAGQLYRLLGFDAAGIVEIRVVGESIGTQKAVRTHGTVDGWNLQLSEDNAELWAASSVRVRSVLRAMATANVQRSDAVEIEDVSGTLTLVSADKTSIEVGFGRESAGGYVKIETVVRGGDGIATLRWFGRMKRSLRDSLVGAGLESWRSLEMFDFTMSQIVWCEVMAGDDRVVLERSSMGWGILEPWVARADSESVAAMLGLTLGLSAERFFDETMYSDDLTGLNAPIARIAVGRGGSDGVTSIELGSAVDNFGDEVFARYTLENGQSAVVSIKTKGLGRLTPSALGYVHQSASLLGRIDIREVKFFASDGAERMKYKSTLGQWERDGKALTPSQREAVDRLIGVLTTEKASTLLVLKNNEEPEATMIGEIALYIDGEDGGEEAERFEVGVESTEGSIRLYLVRRVDDETRLVWVCSSAQAAGSGAWLATLSTAAD